MNKPIFISGPHGGGKTTLVNKLIEKNGIFIENDFDIDYLKDFPSIKSLSNFERCLLRLYHRIYLTNYAHSYAEQNPGKVVITSRGIYDSAAYINTYENLNWVTLENHSKLQFILNHSGYTPYTIILNPPVEVVLDRLADRRNKATRSDRDKVFKSEDSIEFVEEICSYFASLKNEENILYLEDNSDHDIEKILSWIKQINQEKLTIQ